MRKRALRTVVLSAAFGGIVGLAAAGVWDLDRPDVTGELYYLSDSSGDLPLRPDHPESTFTGAGFWDFAPTPASQLPVSLWLALPLTGAVVGVGIGAAASASGFRITRTQPDPATGTSPTQP